MKCCQTLTLLLLTCCTARQDEFVCEKLPTMVDSEVQARECAPTLRSCTELHGVSSCFTQEAVYCMVRGATDLFTAAHACSPTLEDCEWWSAHTSEGRRMAGCTLMTTTRQYTEVRAAEP